MKKRGPKQMRVMLADAHKNSGKTVYAVAKELDIPFNTVKRYVTKDVVVELIPADVFRLAAYYGLQWQQVVEIVQPEAEDNSSGQLKTLLAPA